MHKKEIVLLQEVLIHVPDMYVRGKEVGDTMIHFVMCFNDIDKTIRYGTVVSKPDLYDTVLEVGDIVYFHHNIVKRKKSMDGKDMHGTYEINRQEGLYGCPLDQIYGIQRGDEFFCLEPFCFVKPVKNEIVQKKGEVLTVNQYTEKPNLGTIKYGNKELAAKGYNEGDNVVFKNDAEYEFKIKGEKLYRMRTRQIIGTWDGH